MTGAPSHGRGALLALDQGTSGTKALLVAEDGSVTATAHRALGQHYPAPDHVEQDPEEIWRGILGVLADLTGEAGTAPAAGLSLSAQREAVLAWDPATGRPLSPLVSWQDRRTASRCRELAAGPHAAMIGERTGLPVDPMFSATKAAWLLDALDPDRALARAGRIRIGTVDAWLLHRLTGGTAGPDGGGAIEAGCAARTQMLALDTADWDEELLELFGVPRAALPHVVPSTGELGRTRGVPGLPDGLPVGAVLGDSHAALFAQSHGRGGVVKATYGSGSSLMVLCPPGVTTPEGVSRTLAWQRAGEKPEQALEANIAAAGTAVRWAATLLGTDSAGVARLAEQARGAEQAGEGGLFLVPAFSGLGAPYWDRSARALLVGLGLDSGPPQVARAAVESIAYQVADTLGRFDAVLGPVAELCADGGATGNDLLMSFQADLIGRTVQRAGRPETSALGAAHLAGTALGLWSESDLAAISPSRTPFVPARDAHWREERMRGWRDAVARSRAAGPDDAGAL